MAEAVTGAKLVAGQSSDLTITKGSYERHRGDEHIAGRPMQDSEGDLTRRTGAP